MARLQFRLQALILVVVVIAFFSAAVAQTVRLQRQAEAELASARAMRDRMAAELARQKAARPPRPIAPPASNP